MSSELDLRRYRFLIVDDAPFIHEIVRRILVDLKAAEIRTAQDGSQALAILKAANPPVDCVITDFNMEPMNGVEFLKAIRTGTEGVPRDLPVMMLTGYTDETLVGTALALDANAFLAKPVSRNTLVERLTRVLSEPHPVRAKLAYSIIPEIGVGQLGREAASPADGATASSAPSKSVPAKPRAPGGGAPGIMADSSIDSPRRFTLSTVPAGSVLARNIATKAGVTLLSAATVLQPKLIQRLREIGEIHDMVDEVWVWPKTTATGGGKPAPG